MGHYPQRSDERVERNYPQTHTPSGYSKLQVHQNTGFIIPEPRNGTDPKAIFSESDLKEIIEQEGLPLRVIMVQNDNGILRTNRITIKSINKPQK